MSTPAAGDCREEGVEFIHEESGLVTARDLETGLAADGELKAEALAMLAEVLTLHEGGGEPIEDETTFLREMGLDPEETEAARKENDELPEFLR